MRKNTTTNRRSNATKVIASVALLAGAASVAGLGTFGAFTDTTAADQKVSTGTVEFDGLKTGLGVDVAGMVPGDWIERPLTLTRAANSVDFGTVTLTTTATGDALLTSDVTNGLQLAIDACDVEWKVNADKSMTCSGTAASPAPLVEGAVLGADRTLTGVAAALNKAGKESHLRVTLTLPKAAGNDFRNLSTTVKFDLTATQRDGKAL
ncbi:TasA family protein [Nocardioides ochotonae]|uniref:TasA family protein n=1 Tax=Nocardioides ochotonae TaxID=2685869 RepID=UPI00140D1E3B|nr:TasA family protein [Nocardioides ochotonae]